MKTEKEFFSPEYLAESLGIPIRTLYMWRSRGVGPRGYKIGKHVRYKAQDVEEWLETRSDEARGDGAP